MKLRYRTKAKPVTISVNIGGVECSDLDLLKKNFRINDFFPLMKRNDCRMRKWLIRNGKLDLADDFDIIVNRYEEYKSSINDTIMVREMVYLDLLKIFFSDDFQNYSVDTLLDALKVWWNIYNPEKNKNLKYLMEYICRNYEGCSAVYNEFPTKLTAEIFFNFCIHNEQTYEDAVSLYLENLNEHKDWFNSEKIFDVVSDLYWRDRKSEYLFLVAKLLVENFPQGEGLQIGISCLIKAAEQNNEDAIKYLVGECPQELICQSYNGCKVYFEKYPSKESFDKFFDMCILKTREYWRIEDYEQCVNLANDHPQWIEVDKLFDVSSDMFWMTYNPQSLYYTALYMIEKYPDVENCQVGVECLMYAANHLKYEPAVVYLNQHLKITPNEKVSPSSTKKKLTKKK